ncbi:MAG: hypothetical protein ACI8Z1_002968 [Candidatus Azotimanducaceae bacterium]|jgi:uncharacterized protein (TIGR00299 family) protein
MALHLHLDLVGGLSGDMFIGAMLDTFPEFSSKLDDVIRDAGFPDLVDLDLNPHNDGVLTGSRFSVAASHTEAEVHHHRHYSEIKKTLNDSNLDAPVLGIALSMFHSIAEVEAEIHGKSVSEVAFHEVGAWDSIADVVLASFLIHQCGASSFSVSAIPIGRGFVQTAHGRLPVPAPATARLLEGFRIVDDGIEGERVTPTGAAILKYLAPAGSIPDGLKMLRTGYGFGQKVFPGLSNTVRIGVFETADVSTEWDEDRVVKLAFELDDQTPESIAGALSQLRDEPGVLDAIQHPFWGKKGRQGVSVTLLVNVDAAKKITRLCFQLTTTLGIRREAVTRSILRREEVVVFVGERSFRVKVARRPEGFTAKVEMDDLLQLDVSHAEQLDIRRQAEQLAIREVEDQI